jgi:hypothetical protein
MPPLRSGRLKGFDRSFAQDEYTIWLVVDSIIFRATPRSYEVQTMDESNSTPCDTIYDLWQIRDLPIDRVNAM